MQNNGLKWFFILNYLGQKTYLLRAEFDQKGSFGDA